MSRKQTEAVNMKAEKTETTEPAQEVVEEDRQESAPQEKREKNQLIYIGPTLPGGFLAQHTVFRDGIPKHLDGIRNTYPQVDTLIVPIEQLLEAQAELQHKGTAIQQAYQALSRKE
ncbi:hypothetical protein [Brevibacillus fulvus]|uniref:Uncharacterized protein n=1 Tax=Brevibacillus fulvus TaxID=1125967 RepID=A0A938Y2U2_9BACL|nr:hypothetical protein [Brevibacillus fulvus]MBM7592256.1 hypothetical protein [Brevibacillus fulvus]